MKLNLSLINSKILLITGIAIVLGCNNNNVNLKKGIRDSTENLKKCELGSLIYRTSFQYIYSDLFKTGKIKHLDFCKSSDTIIIYEGEKLNFKINNFVNSHRHLNIGYSSNKLGSILLIVLDSKKYFFEIRENGVFQFIGYNTKKYFFSFSFSKCILFFSFDFNDPRVDLVEYTVMSN